MKRKSTVKKLKALFLLALLFSVVVVGLYLAGIDVKIVPQSVKNGLDAITGEVSHVAGISEGSKKLVDVYEKYVAGLGGADTGVEITQDVVSGMEIPSYVKGHQVVAHNGFTLSYNEDYEQPDWVAYELTVEELNTNNTSRTEDFREDPAIVTQSAHLDDYRNSGYDRGHLCPSADRTSSVEKNSETFLLSNMSPQLHRFNAGLWLKAEGAVRDAARDFGKVYVVTGPVFSDDMKTIGPCNVAVPGSFYKVVLGVKNGEVYAIGLICPQEYQNGNLKPYLCSVNDVEKMTGLDFFPSLDDAIEEKVESTYSTSAWPKVFNL